jgi:hypothetical protein
MKREKRYNKKLIKRLNPPGTAKPQEFARSFYLRAALDSVLGAGEDKPRRRQQPAEAIIVLHLRRQNNAGG